MSKRLEAPISRLICVGSAKVCTNAPENGDVEEYDNGPKFISG